MWRKNLFWIWFDVQFCHGVSRSDLYVTYVRYVGGLRTEERNLILVNSG